MEKVDLKRYEASARLGVGADYEVRAALDTKTGKQVVLKRPVPQMVSRQQHGGIEARTEKTLEVYQELNLTTPLVTPILGYTDSKNHDEFFGDSLGQEYRVMIAERAPGIPLLADHMARIRGVPIGAGQNLFALYPLLKAKDSSSFPVQRQLVELEEIFLNAGYLLLDLRPQNIYYQPGSGQINVIDCGALISANGEPDRRGRPAQDINDFCLEILKFYTTPQLPPVEAAGYKDPYGLRPVANFNEELEEMIRVVPEEPGPYRETLLHILNKIRDRVYGGISEFRTDIDCYLDALTDRNEGHPEAGQANSAWLEAAEWLKADYWRGFMFDPDTELSGLIA